MKRAIFLDRDGVLNRNVWYRDTGAWESPRLPHEFRLADGVLPALAMLRDAGFLLFVVSNQPNVAKGKAPPGALQAMHTLLTEALMAHGLSLADAFYCTHHPSVNGPCPCRKPSPYFLQKAARENGLLLRECWMVGDRVTDMECGRAAGTRTGWVHTGQEPEIPHPFLVDIQAADLRGVAEKLLKALL